MKTNMTQINLLKEAAANCFVAYYAFMLTFCDFNKADATIHLSNPTIKRAFKDVCTKLKCFIIVVALFGEVPKALKAGLPEEYIEFIQSDIVSEYPLVFLQILEKTDVSLIDFQNQVEFIEVVLRKTEKTIKEINSKDI